MLALTSQLFTIKDLQNIAGPSGAWFSDKSPQALVGRCLVDAMEYLRADPRFPGQYSEVANAHAVRLVALCLSDDTLNRPEHLSRFERRLNEVLQCLLKSRNDTSPHYGDDYWDWAAILECFLEAKEHIPNSFITTAILEEQMVAFKKAVEEKLGTGLTTGSKAEWYGPATAAAAHRVLGRWSSASQWSSVSHQDIDLILKKLKEQALEMISDGKYRRRRVAPDLILWHYGQVVGEFPTDSTLQRKQIRELKNVSGIVDTAYRVYALSRVIQGARNVSDNKTIAKATKLLYDCQNLDRPLGQGLLGDRVKGSLNVLEALWPTLQSQEKTKIWRMVDALVDVYSRANTVGVLVAIERELLAMRKAFVDDGATINGVNDPTKFTASHPEYRAVVRCGKSGMAASDTTRDLLSEDQAKWLFMVGIAGSLGTPSASAENQPTSGGPNLGDVVLATSLAPYKIREKIREVSENAPVPFRGENWTIIPTNPSLFACAHKAAHDVFPNSTTKVHEGVIVTGTGIKDALKEKAEILSIWPGGLAVEEEGYFFALLCLNGERPYMVIRGISDFAGGDKKKQQDPGGNEKSLQKDAAEHAAKVAVAAIKILSNRW